MTHGCRPGRRAGFTLLELSIVLLVLGLIVAGIMGMMTQHIRRVKQAELDARLNSIETALLNFRRLNDRIPCPADGTTAITSSSFGTETTPAGACSSGSASGTFNDGGNTAGGVVPVRTLGLPDSDMFDPWGGRFTYAVDMRMTNASAFTTYGPTDTTVGSITVNDGSGAVRTSQAILVIVSHGPNGHGAFQLSGARKSSGSTNAAELKNCHCNNDGSNGTFDSTFVQEPNAGVSTDILNNYDDTVRYYVRAQLLSASELQ